MDCRICSRVMPGASEDSLIGAGRGAGCGGGAATGAAAVYAAIAGAATGAADVARPSGISHWSNSRKTVSLSAVARTLAGNLKESVVHMRPVPACVEMLRAEIMATRIGAEPTATAVTE